MYITTTKRWWFSRTVLDLIVWQCCKIVLSLFSFFFQFNIVVLRLSLSLCSLSREKIEMASRLTLRFRSHLHTASLLPSSLRHHPLISSLPHFSLHRLLSTACRISVHSNKSVVTGAHALALDTTPLDLRAQL